MVVVFEKRIYNTNLFHSMFSYFFELYNNLIAYKYRRMYV